MGSGVPRAGELRGQWELPSRPGAVSVARHRVADLLSMLGLAPDVVETAALLTSELVTNAVRHTATRRVEVRVRVGPGIVVEVTDFDGDTKPRARRPRPDEEGGRGLFLVEEMAHRWGVEQGVGSKVIWFELA